MPLVIELRRGTKGRKGEYIVHHSRQRKIDRGEGRGDIPIPEKLDLVQKLIQWPNPKSKSEFQKHRVCSEVGLRTKLDFWSHTTCHGICTTHFMVFQKIRTRNIIWGISVQEGNLIM
jgi:hypothetical protein